MLRVTATKVDAPPPLDLTGFAELAVAFDLPAGAIGGIAPADMRSLRLSGAAGAVIVSGIFAWRDRVLVAAKPYFRTAMVKRLTVALVQGGAPGQRIGPSVWSRKRASFRRRVFAPAAGAAAGLDRPAGRHVR